MTNPLLTARENAGITQATLAQQVGVSVDTIRRAEQGKYTPRPMTLIRIARALGIPLESLVKEKPRT